MGSPTRRLLAAGLLIGANEMMTAVPVFAWSCDTEQEICEMENGYICYSDFITYYPWVHIVCCDRTTGEESWDNVCT
jgi:hypothetical protein